MPSVVHFPTCWVGVDLNAADHLAVLAEPASGFVHRIGTAVSPDSDPFRSVVRARRGRQYTRPRHRLRFLERAICLSVSREIVRVARQLACGIKFERLNARRLSRESGSSIRAMLRVQRFVEEGARRAGIPVRYVDPAATSKRCHRCWAVGRRDGKRFECETCGLVAHADVNAALNIAAAPLRCADAYMHTDPDPSRRSLRRHVRAGPRPPAPAGTPFRLFDGPDPGCAEGNAAAPVRDPPIPTLIELETEWEPRHRPLGYALYQVIHLIELDTEWELRHGR